MGTVFYYLFFLAVCMLISFLILHKGTSKLSNKEIDDVIKKLQKVKRTRRSSDPQYTYFVNFHMLPGTLGNCEMQTYFPISSMDDVRNLEKSLSRQYEKSCIIMNYQLLRDGSDDFKDNLIANMRDIILEWHKIVNAPRQHDKTKMTLLKNSDNKIVDILKDISKN